MKKYHATTILITAVLAITLSLTHTLYRQSSYLQETNTYVTNLRDKTNH